MQNRYIPIFPVLFLTSCFLFLGKNLVAQTQLSVNCQALETFLCEGFCAEMYPIVTGGAPPYSFLWSGAAGLSSTDQNPTFCNPGLYTLSVSDTSGQVFTCSFFIEIQPAPTPEIVVQSGQVCQDSLNGNTQFGCEDVCPNATVTYYAIDPSTGQPYGVNSTQGQVAWSANNAQSSYFDPSKGTFTVTWGAPGTGSVFFTAYDFFLGCELFADKCINVIEPPKAEIGTNPARNPGTDTITVCKAQQVYFQNQTLQSEQINWDFGDGITSILENPNHTYSQAGVYEVTLIANSACFCNDTSKVFVEVLDGDAPLIDCVGTICAGETVTYTTSSTCSPFTWAVSPNGSIVGGGVANSNSIVVQWNTGAVGEILLSVPACVGACARPAVVEIPIIDDNAEIEGPVYVCPNDERDYSIEAFGGVGFTWKVLSGGTLEKGQGTDKVTIKWNAGFSPTTARKVVVNYENCYLGCSGSDTLDVFILSQHTISGPVEICAADTGDFIAKRVAGNVNITCDWELSDENDAIIWQSAAASSAVSIPFPNQVGFFFLKAKVTNPADACTEEAFWTIQTRANPPALIGIDGPATICPNGTYPYAVQGALPDLIVEWQLTGATTPTATGKNTLITWAGAAPFELEAVQKTPDNLACSSSPVTFSAVPATIPPIVGPNMSCEQNATSYSIATSISDEAINWTISPSDAGTIASGQGTTSVEVFWTKPGIATLTASVCGLSEQKNITINAIPSTTINHPIGLCPGDLASVSATGAFVNYLWSNADGTPAGAGPSPSVGPGSYSLLVVDANACSASAEFTIESHPVPEVTLSTPDPTGFCNNSLFVKMTALTTTDADYDYEWFRNGASIGTNAPNHSDNQYGSYTVQVTNAWGCTALSNPIVVFEYCTGSVCHNPSVNPCADANIQFSAVQGAFCNEFTFTNTTPNSNYIAGSEEWLLIGPMNFPNNPELGSPLNYTFDAAGHYVLIMEVSYQDAMGNKATCGVVDSVKVRAAAAFSVEEQCPGSATAFTDISTLMPGESLVSWTWDFGDPTSGVANTFSGKDATHIYANPGFYSVELTITTSTGCQSKRTERIEIQAPPALDFIDPSATCEDEAVGFTFISGAPLVDLTWNFDDPLSGAANASTAQNPFHTFADAGTYLVSVTGANAYGCVGSFSKNISIGLNTLSGNLAANPMPPLCEGTSTILSAPSGANAWNWSTGETTSSISVSAENIYSVQLQDVNGCVYSPPKMLVEISDKPVGIIKAFETNAYGQVSAIFEDTYSTCAGEPVYLEIQSSGTNTYTWSSGQSGNLLQFDDGHDGFLPVGTHTFTVVITESSSGCTNSAGPFMVIIHPKPSTPYVSSTAWPICAGSPTPLTLSPIEPSVQYTWNTGEVNTSISATTSGEFYVVAMNTFGCRAQSNRFEVQPGPRVEAVPAGCHTRCNPDTLCLPSLPNISTYQWHLNGVAMGTASATSPELIATESGVYTLEMTDFYGCVALSAPLEVELYTGYGTIQGFVYDDVNQNGVIDAADTLVAGVPLLLGGLNTNLTGTSGPSGNYAFANILAQNYAVQIDAANLPNGWSIEIGQGNLALVGCDAIETLDFLIRKDCPQVFGFETIMACQGDSALYNGMYFYPGTTDTVTLTASSGCDSLVSLVCMALPPPPLGFETIMACQGDSVLYNGMYFYPGTTDTVTLTASSGCDSLVNLVCSALPTQEVQKELFVCANDSIQFNSVWYFPDDKDTLVFNNAIGCDSTVYVTCTSLETAEFEESVTLCPGDFYLFQSDTLWPGDLRFVTLQSSLGCDSTVKVEVFATPNLTYTVESSPDCIGQFLGKVWCAMPSGTTVDLDYSLDGLTYQADSLFTGLSAKTGTLWLKDAADCVFSAPFEIEENRPPLGTLPELILPCSAESLLIEPNLEANALANSFKWHNNDSLPSLEVMETGAVSVEITNACGTLFLSGQVGEADTSAFDKVVYAANVFAPYDAMADNTQFCMQINPKHQVLSYNLEIYDRWGDLLFLSNSTDDCWDGKHRGKMLAPAVFVWKLNMSIQACRSVMDVREVGDVLLVR